MTKNSSVLCVLMLHSLIHLYKNKSEKLKLLYYWSLMKRTTLERDLCHACLMIDLPIGWHYPQLWNGIVMKRAQPLYMGFLAKNVLSILSKEQSRKIN